MPEALPVVEVLPVAAGVLDPEPAVAALEVSVAVWESLDSLVGALVVEGWKKVLSK